MSRVTSKGSDYAMVAIMGATGTGKSAFIRHLTNDSEICIGDGIDSQTSKIQTSCYTDATTGRSIMLIDTPGFDDSQERITDTDILERIIEFLESKDTEGKRLNGIIYMHRISDNRMGAMARKNLRMFRAIFGDKSLRNVRIVTTHWDSDDGMGPMRESQLKEGPFQSLLASGAQMCRHSNTAESAQAIMAGIIPLPEVTTQIQQEVAKEIPLGETRAGRILDEYIEELRKKHKEELAKLRIELEQAVQQHDEELRTELEVEGGILEERIMRAEEDRHRLAMTMPQLREQQKKVEEVMKKLRTAIAEKAEEVRKARISQPPKVKKLEDELAELGRLNEEAEHHVKLGIFRRLLLDVLAEFTRLITSPSRRSLGQGRVSRQ